MGRPVVEWGEFEIRVVRALASVLSKRQIAFHMGISYPTYLAIERRQPEVAQAFNQGKAMAIAGVAAGILNRALQGSIKDAHFYMRTQGGWVEPKPPEIAPDEDGDEEQQPALDFSKLSTEALSEIVKVMHEQPQAEQE